MYVTPLIGGYVADTFLGRYKTILYFSVLYLIGLGMIVFGSLPGAVVLPVVFMAMVRAVCHINSLKLPIDRYAHLLTKYSFLL